jgi:hypothetical protein
MSYYRPLKHLLVMASVLSCTQLLSACATHTAGHEHSAYAPGLGEFMAQISTRHIKLWYAGDAENWPLADYELEEIHEGLDDLAKYHPTHDKVKGTIPDMVTAYMKAPLEQAEAAIKTKNIDAFRAGYDSLTAGCNSCHQANSFGFNVIARPYGNPFTNQSFRTKP